MLPHTPSHLRPKNNHKSGSSSFFLSELLPLAPPLDSRQRGLHCKRRPRSPTPLWAVARLGTSSEFCFDEFWRVLMCFGDDFLTGFDAFGGPQIDTFEQNCVDAF